MYFDLIKYTREMAPTVDKHTIFPFILVIILGCDIVNSQLDYRFYDATCPNLSKIVKYSIWPVIANDTRMAASLLRLQFHDCIVNVICRLYCLFLI